MIDIGQIVNIEKIQVENFNDLKFRDDIKQINLEKSILKYGQLKPLLVNEKLELVEGYRLYLGLKSKKIEEVWIKVIKKDTSALNSELCLLNFDLDAIKFYEQLTKIDLKDNCIPLSYSELKRYIELLTFDWNKFSKRKKSKLKNGGLRGK